MNKNIDFSVADICDDHPQSIQVANLSLISYGAKDSFFGEIETIQCPDDNSLVKDILNTPGNNRVLIIDASGVSHASMVGDQIAAKAAENNWNGIIVNGFIRDVDILKTIPIAIYAKGSIPKKTDKNGMGDIGAEVFVGGILIKPKNWVYFDSNGWVISKKELKL